MAKAEYKVPGGKLVRVEVQTKNSKITRIKISGDFFLHPEEDINHIEKAVLNMSFNEGELTKTINETIMTRDIKCVGVDAKAFARAIMKTTEHSNQAENNK